MKDHAANRRFLLTLMLLGLGWLVCFQPASHWSGAIQISSVRIAFSFQSDTVRFRTLSSGNGHSFLSVGDDTL